MNNADTSLEQLQIHVLEREVVLLQNALACSFGRSPSRVTQRVSQEGFFDIFKPAVTKKDKVGQALEDLEQLKRRVQAHQPGGSVREVTGLLALLKNSNRFKQTIHDLAACLVAEEKFLDVQLAAHERACAAFNELVEKGDLATYYAQYDKICSSVQPVVPSGFKKKMLVSDRKSSRKQKHLMMLNGIETVCVQTGFDELHFRRKPWTSELIQEFVEEPWFPEFTTYGNVYSFGLGPLEQFSGTYSGDEDLKSSILDLLTTCGAALKQGEEKVRHGQNSDAANRTLNLGSHEEACPELTDKLGVLVEALFEYGWDLLGNAFQYQAFAGIESVDTSARHLAVAYLKT